MQKISFIQCGIFERMRSNPLYLDFVRIVARILFRIVESIGLAARIFRSHKVL